MNERVEIPPALQAADSAVAALRASQSALLGRHFDPFPQPRYMRVLAALMNRLPIGARVRVIDFMSASLGHPARELAVLDTSRAAQWVVSGYPGEKYRGCILGAPGLAVANLSALTGFPYLPQPLLYNARRDMARDDAQGVLDAGLELAERVVARNPGIEAIIHFDPVHDRFLISRVIFIRLNYTRLPDAYREFITRRLAPGSTVILVDCRYRWPLAEVSKAVFFQLGGLGDIPPEDFLAETDILRNYRKAWGAPDDASWRIKGTFVDLEESEWGSRGDFLNDADELAKSAGCRTIRFIHDHPFNLSKAVFSLFERCRSSQMSEPRVYVSSFTHTEPWFPMVTGSTPLWLPFITSDNLKLCGDFLNQWRERLGVTGQRGTVYVTLHPSFCSPPDLVSIESWRGMLSEFFKEIRLLGIDPKRYPADIACYVSMYPAVVREAKKISTGEEMFRKPSGDEIESAFSEHGRSRK